MKKIIFMLYIASVISPIGCGNPEEKPSDRMVKERPSQNEPGKGMEEVNQDGPFDEKLSKNPITILSLDGGGVKGLMTIALLEGIEEETGKSSHQLFDIIAGTASGGIIALATTAKVNGNKIRSAREIKDFLVSHASDLFGKHQSKTGGVLSPTPRSKALTKLFGKNSLFKNLVKPTLITAVDYGWEQGYSIESDLPKFDNLNLRDVAHLTMRNPYAPKDFSLKNDFGTKEIHSMIGGEIYKDNPALLAFDKAETLFGADEIKKRGIVLISLGAGRPQGREPIGPKLVTAGSLGWLGILVPAMVDGSATEDDDVITVVFKEIPHSKAFRIDPNIDINKPISRANNVDQANVKDLLDLADKVKKSAGFKSAVEVLKKIR